MCRRYLTSLARRNSPSLQPSQGLDPVDIRYLHLYRYASEMLMNQQPMTHEDCREDPADAVYKDPPEASVNDNTIPCHVVHARSNSRPLQRRRAGRRQLSRLRSWRWGGEKRHLLHPLTRMVVPTFNTCSDCFAWLHSRRRHWLLVAPAVPCQ